MLFKKILNSLSEINSYLYKIYIIFIDITLCNN